MIKFAALFFGAFLICIGILGIAAPETFFAAVRFFQKPSVFYLAAVIRVIVGVVLILAARESRFPNIFRVLGILITIGGLLTPFFEVQMAAEILDSWNAPTLRLWAGFPLALGIFIGYAIITKRRATY